MRNYNYRDAGVRWAFRIEPETNRICHGRRTWHQLIKRTLRAQILAYFSAVFIIYGRVCRLGYSQHILPTPDLTYVYIIMFTHWLPRGSSARKMSLIVAINNDRILLFIISSIFKTRLFIKNIIIYTIYFGS